MQMLPSGKPQLKVDDALNLLSHFNVSQYAVKLFGIRGYYMHSMGDPGKNDIGIYDDAMFVMAPNKLMLSYNANTDPSRSFPGVAVLKAHGKINQDGTVTVYNPEPYIYKIGMHGISGPSPYRAFRQEGRVTVLRNGKEETDTDRNPFYIDIHRGGYNTTSSLGCQTIHPDQWPDTFATGERLMHANQQKFVPYILLEY